jgi:hypothetical protein
MSAFAKWKKSGNGSRVLLLTEPIVSISRTVLKALAERPEIGETKLPAAPALDSTIMSRKKCAVEAGGFSHNVVDPSQFLHASLNSTLHALYTPHINSSDTDHFGSLSCSGYALSHSLRLLDISSDNASIGTEVNQRPDLSTANGSCPSSTEDDLVV